MGDTGFLPSPGLKLSGLVTIEFPHRAGPHDEVQRGSLCPYPKYCRACPAHIFFRQSPGGTFMTSSTTVT